MRKSTCNITFFMPFCMALYMIFCLHPCLFAQRRAVINVSAAYLRSAPDYESPLETQELMGVVVEVLDTDRYWVKVSTPQPYTAWVNGKMLTAMTDEQLEEYGKTPKYKVTALHSTIFEAPSYDSLPVCDLVAGDILRVAQTAEPASHGRKHSSKHLRKSREFTSVMLPDGRLGWVRSSDVCREDELQERLSRLSEEEVAALAASWAEKMLGVPYLWGGMSTKGADCSGLVRLAYLMNGVTLPRNASQQYAAGEDIPLNKLNDSGNIGGKPGFDLSSLRRGDLLFFGPQRADGSRAITHVGIYLGDGRMIHASQIVRINSLRPGDPDVYENLDRLHKACRIR